MGPIDVVILTFPRAGRVASVGPILEDLVDAGHVRVVDAILVVRAATGKLAIHDLDNSIVPRWTSISTSPTPLLSAEDAALAGETVGPDGAALVVVVEHIWPNNLAEFVVDSGGSLDLYARIDPDTVSSAETQSS